MKFIICSDEIVFSFNKFAPGAPFRWLSLYHVSLEWAMALSIEDRRDNFIADDMNLFIANFHFHPPAAVRVVRSAYIGRHETCSGCDRWRRWRQG